MSSREELLKTHEKAQERQVGGAMPCRGLLLPYCCCGLVLLWLCCGSVQAVVTVDAVVSQCVRAYVCTRGRAYNVYRLTCKFVVAAVVAVEIRVRACIMCRPWTQICRLIFGSAIFNSNYQETDGQGRGPLECVKCLISMSHGPMGP